MGEDQNAEVLVVGGGIAGLSAAICLGRAERDVLVADAGHSAANWTPEIESYPGFPEGIAGAVLLQRLREQAHRFGARIVDDEITKAGGERGRFMLGGRQGRYTASRVLLAPGIPRPPRIQGIDECLGHSVFLCADSDGCRALGKRVAVHGCTNEAAQTALALLFHTPRVTIVTDGQKPRWDERHGAWLREYAIPVCCAPIVAAGREGSRLRALKLPKGVELEVDALFTTFAQPEIDKLARRFGARADAEGRVRVDANMRTSVKGLYAAGWVTTSNCQMIIAAGQGAAAARAIHRDLFQAELAMHALRQFRAGNFRRPARVRGSDGGVIYGKHRKNHRSGRARKAGLQALDAF